MEEQSAGAKSGHLFQTLPEQPSSLMARMGSALRFVLPPQTTLVFAGNALERPPHVDAWRVAPFPQFGDESAAGATVLTRLQEFQERGCDFLLLPKTTFSWLERQVEVKRYLEQRCRLILHDPDLCTIHALQEAKAEPLRIHGAPDGLPLPPPEMIRLVAGIDNTAVFYWGGVLGARWIRGILAKNGLDITQCDTLLDFGCGCGRILRHWQALNGPQLFGTDYNPYLIQWCQRALPFVACQTNELAPPLPYEDGQFDLIYTISIFTHLEEQLQLLWMEELKRILKPGGRLLFTVHGLTHLHVLTAEQRALFEAGELVVSRPEHSGDNECSTYHPESYVRRVLAKEFLIVDFIPGGAKDANQDVFLVQKFIV
jgi:SAM-dependent methyltransferase